MNNINDFLESIREKLDEYYGDEYTVKINKVTKNNSTVKNGLTIRKKGSRMAPNIYLDDAYEDYVNGKSLQDITTGIIAARAECRDEIEFDADRFLDYEWVRRRLSIKLVDKDKNGRQLKEVPHVEFYDMAVVFYVDIEEDSIGKGSIMIRNEHMDEWAINVKKLYTDAINSVTRKSPPVMKDIVSVLLEMVEERYEGEDESAEKQRIEEMLRDTFDVNPMMYVITNQSKNNGAAVIAYPGMLHDVGETFGCDFYLLPSSVNEVIVVAINDAVENGLHLSEMVKEINATNLTPEEVLTDHAYRYHRRTNWLEPLTEPQAHLTEMPSAV